MKIFFEGFHPLDVQYSIAHDGGLPNRHAMAAAQGDVYVGHTEINNDDRT